MRESAGTVPLFGLTGWTGLRMAGQWSFTDDWRAETAGLRHGDPNDPAAPNLVVATTRLPTERVVKQLQQEHTRSVHPPGGDAGPAEWRRSPGPDPVGENEFTVDGAPRIFQVWQESEDRWQAACRLDEEYTLVLDAYRFAPADVTLTRVRDLEPCLIDRRNWIRTYYGQ